METQEWGAWSLHGERKEHKGEHNRRRERQAGFYIDSKRAVEYDCR